MATENKQLLQNGLWHNNPALVQLLGLCPLLAVSNTTINGLALGLATTVTLVVANTLVSLTRHRVLHEIRIPVFILLIAGIVTVIDLLMNALLHQLYLNLGLFIPLIVTNCVILARAESFASRRPLRPSIIDGVAMGTGFSLVLLTLGAIRELLGTGWCIHIARATGCLQKPAATTRCPHGHRQREQGRIMIFSNDRTALRRQYLDVWQKAGKQQPLEPLETLIADVIREHPEYHPLLNNPDAAIDSEFYPEHGATNPFLHMGMHIALREQVGTDRPAGIADLTRKLLLQYRDSHEMEHRMMDALGEVLWQAQREGSEPDQQHYMELLQTLLAKRR